MSTFGAPINNETLEAMSRYRNKTITQEDRAREAIRLIHAEDKNLEALNYVLKIKSKYGNGVVALCLIYNATGGPVELVEKMDWLGYVYEAEPPRYFDNGQWIAFLHAHPTSQALGCEAARVFRGKNVNGEERDFLVAWNVPWDSTPNSAYTEVREKNHFPQYWDYLRSLLHRAPKITMDKTGDQHCQSTASVGGMLSPEFIAILEHKFNPLP